MLPAVQVLMANKAWYSSLNTSQSSESTETTTGDKGTEDAKLKAQERGFAWRHRSGRYQQRHVSGSHGKGGTHVGWVKDKIPGTQHT